MFYLFFSNLFFFFILSGIGQLTSHFSFLKIRKDNYFLSFFLGMSLAAMYFAFIQFFCPLTVWTLIPVILAGLSGCIFFLTKQENKGTIKRIIIRNRWYFLAVLIVFFMTSYNCSKAEGVTFVDTRFYHASIVSWMNAYKIIPGLSNLFGNLGFSSLYLQLAAGLDVGAWDKQMSSILFSLFYTSFILYAATDIYNAASKKYKGSLSVALFQCVMVGWFFTHNTLDDPSLYYDKPALAFIAITLAELIFQQERDNAKCSFESIFLFAATAFGIKLIGVVSVIFSFGYIVFFKIKTKSLSVPALFKLILLPLCILVLYIARNLIQTGYPFVPSTMFRMNLPWTVPEENAIHTYELIYYGARWASGAANWGTPAPFWDWFPSWCDRLLYPENLQYSIITLISLVLFVRSCIKKQKESFFFYFFIFANLIYWAISAPSFRFGNGFFYDLLATALFFNEDLFAPPLSMVGTALRKLMPFGRTLKDFFSKRKIQLAIIAVLILCACLLALPAVQDALISLGGKLKGKELSEQHWKRELFKYVRCCIIIAVGLSILPLVFKIRKSAFSFACCATLVFFACKLATKNRNLLMTVPVKPEITERRLVNEEQNFYINVSTNVDLCGDAELPCIPDNCFTPKLRLFDKDDMGKGFYIEE